MKQKNPHGKTFKPALYIVVSLLILLMGGLCFKIIYLNLKEKNFIQNQAAKISIHKKQLTPQFGSIYDRNDFPLAVTTTLYQWILDPKVILENQKQHPFIHNAKLQAKIDALQLYQFDAVKMLNYIKNHPDKRYYKAAQFVTPEQKYLLESFKIPGFHFIKQLRSYYPDAEASAPLIGFTNFDNQPQAGLELTLAPKLYAHSGIETILTDPKGDLVKTLAISKNYKKGKNIHLSIDQHIQDIAYLTLKEGVIAAKAKSGSIIILDPKTSEVLAAVSYPSFNPNSFHTRTGNGLPARGIIETFEPGSVIKPFFVAEGLKSGLYTPDTMIDTSPGYYMLHGHKIRDDANFGNISVTQVLQKSSNVGVSKIALSLPHDTLYRYLQTLGFGAGTMQQNFPRENAGILLPYASLSDFEYATMSFGYAMTTSLLQLTHAYTAFANNGKLCPISFYKLKNLPMHCSQVLPIKVANEVKEMLTSVITMKGTGFLANIPGFQVGGKTGTSHRVGKNGFEKNNNNALFIGIVPIKHPKLVIGVWMESPSRNRYYQYGGVASAPLFAKIARESLAYMGVKYEESLENYKNFNKNKRWIWQLIEKN